MPTPGDVFSIETAASSTSFHGGGSEFGSNARLLAAWTLWYRSGSPWPSPMRWMSTCMCGFDVFPELPARPTNCPACTGVGGFGFCDTWLASAGQIDVGHRAVLDVGVEHQRVAGVDPHEVAVVADAGDVLVRERVVGVAVGARDDLAGHRHVQTLAPDQVVVVPVAVAEQHRVVGELGPCRAVPTTDAQSSANRSQNWLRWWSRNW